MNSKKIVASALSSLFLLNVAGFTAQEVHASTTAPTSLTTLQTTNNLTQEEMNDIFIKAIDESAYLFNDPTVADDLKESLSGVQNEGKATMAAKTAGYAIKALIKKVGQKGWDAMIKKVESSTGASLVILHYKSINGLVNFLTGFQGDVEDGITSYLQKHGFNSYFARLTAKAFVLIVL